MSEPVSQAFLVDVLNKSDELHLAGHSRLRTSLNELKEEIREDRRSQWRRLEDHSERLKDVEVSRREEARTRLASHEDHRARTVRTSGVTTTVVLLVWSIAQFVIGHVWK